MIGDLVTDDVQVHDAAAAVIDFWFGLPTEKHFAKDAALDREIGARFEAVRDDLIETRARGWRGHPDDLLAAIVVIDQFSRNIHRGTAEAFAGDDVAAELTLAAIGKGWEARYAPARRAFLYLPLMHAEDAPLQDLSLAKYEALGLADNLAFARDHRAVFLRFGRFPERNAALDRVSGAAEAAYLAQPGAGW